MCQARARACWSEEGGCTHIGAGAVVRVDKYLYVHSRCVDVIRTVYTRVSFVDAWSGKKERDRMRQIRFPEREKRGCGILCSLL